MQGISSMRLMFVAAMSLAAGAGYWWGASQQDTRSGENERVMSARERGEVVVNASRRSAVDVVRETIKGSLDDREQWRQVRGFSEDEVKAAIKELGGRSRIEKFHSDLPVMLFYRWAEIDPVAADEATQEMFPKYFSSSKQAVITSWIKQGGGAAAWNAIRKENGVLACNVAVSELVAEMLVASFSDKDDTSAFEELRQMNDEDCVIADTLCELRSKKASETPESRAAFLAAAAKHPNEFVIKSARKKLFREWANRDTEAALAGVNDLPISEEERESIRSDIR